MDAYMEVLLAMFRSISLLRYGLNSKKITLRCYGLPYVPNT